MSEIMTVKEVAEFLRLSRATVWRMIQEQRLPAFRVGRSWRVRREDVDRLTQPGATRFATSPAPASAAEPALPGDEMTASSLP